MKASRIFLILLALCALAIAWGWLGRKSPPQTVGSPATAEITQPDTAPTLPARPGFNSTFRHASTDAPPGDDSATVLRPPDLAILRPEREALYQDLRLETNAMLAEIESSLKPLHGSDPATLATAWTLANNWAIYAKGDSTLDQRIEDPAMRKQLSDLHRRVLVESVEQELGAFIGGDIQPDVQARLESIGRRYSATATVRKSGPPPDEAAQKAARKRASAGEDPLAGE